MTVPKKLAIQIIGPTTIKRARTEYFEKWDRAWPTGEGYTDSYLAQLIVEAKEQVGIPPSSKAKPAEVREITLELMRADHEFTKPADV